MMKKRQILAISLNRNSHGSSFKGHLELLRVPKITNKVLKQLQMCVLKVYEITRIKYAIEIKVHFTGTKLEMAKKNENCIMLELGCSNNLANLDTCLSIPRIVLKVIVDFIGGKSLIAHLVSRVCVQRKIISVMNLT